ncbi:hypothetical protein SLS61_004077 [Didymella pomorum]
MSFPETNTKPLDLTQARLQQTPSTWDKKNLDAISKTRTQLAEWFRDVRGQGNSERLTDFMKRWSEYTIDLGNIPQDELTKAASLSAPENKSLNVMIYRAIAALNSNIAPKPNPSIRKTPPSGLDPDASRLPSEVQKNAVNFLLSNVCWGIKGLTGLALNSATLVDWPELLVPNPGSGEKVRYDGKNYYRVPVSAIFDTLNGIYREKVDLLQRVVNLMADNSKGPSSMYAAIQLLQFVSGEKPFYPPDPSERDSPTFPKTPFKSSETKSVLFTRYKDPVRSTGIEVETVDQWARLAVVALVLQGYPQE